MKKTFLSFLSLTLLLSLLSAAVVSGETETQKKAIIEEDDTVIETIENYDEQGNLIEKTVEGSFTPNSDAALTAKDPVIVPTVPRWVYRTSWKWNVGLPKRAHADAYSESFSDPGQTGSYPIDRIGASLTLLVDGTVQGTDSDTRTNASFAAAQTVSSGSFVGIFNNVRSRSTHTFEHSHFQNWYPEGDTNNN